MGPSLTREIPGALSRNHELFPSSLATLPYKTNVYINYQLIESFQNGIPQYGNWLLLGPFIEDDGRWEAHHPEFPDYGLPSLPSVTYMNHDKVHLTTRFPTPGRLKILLANKSIFDQGFHATILHP